MGCTLEGGADLVSPEQGTQRVLSCDTFFFKLKYSPWVPITLLPALGFACGTFYLTWGANHSSGSPPLSVGERLFWF